MFSKYAKPGNPYLADVVEYGQTPLFLRGDPGVIKKEVERRMLSAENFLLRRYLLL